MNWFPFRSSNLAKDGALELERTKALEKHAAKILKHNPDLDVTDNELTLLAVIRQFLVRLTIAGLAWQAIGAYRTLKNMARDDKQGTFGFRDVLRYYDCDRLADKLDAAERNIFGSDDHKNPTDEELFEMFEQRQGHRCTCASTDPKRHFLDCALWPHNQPV